MTINPLKYVQTKLTLSKIIKSSIYIFYIIRIILMNWTNITLGQLIWMIFSFLVLYFLFLKQNPYLIIGKNNYHLKQFDSIKKYQQKDELTLKLEKIFREHKQNRIKKVSSKWSQSRYEQKYNLGYESKYNQKYKQTYEQTYEQRNNQKYQNKYINQIACQRSNCYQTLPKNSAFQSSKRSVLLKPSNIYYSSHIQIFSNLKSLINPYKYEMQFLRSYETKDQTNKINQSFSLIRPVTDHTEIKVRLNRLNCTAVITKPTLFVTYLTQFFQDGVKDYAHQITKQAQDLVDLVRNCFKLKFSFKKDQYYNPQTCCTLLELKQVILRYKYQHYLPKKFSPLCLATFVSQSLVPLTLLTLNFTSLVPYISMPSCLAFSYYISYLQQRFPQQRFIMRQNLRKTNRDKMFSIYQNGVVAQFSYHGIISNRETNPLICVGMAMLELMGERKYRGINVFGKFAPIVLFQY